MALDHLSQLLTWRGEHDAAVPLMDEALGLISRDRRNDNAADLICRRAWTRLLSGDRDGRAGGTTTWRRRRPAARGCRSPARRPTSGWRTWPGTKVTWPRPAPLCERALAECPGGSFTTETVRAMALVSLGWLALAEGRPAEAAQLHRSAPADRTAVARGRRRGVRAGGLAGVAQPEQAATLLGAAAGVRGTSIARDRTPPRCAPGASSPGADGFDRAYGWAWG